MCFYTFAFTNLIKQWHSGCLDNHREQVTEVKIDPPVCEEAASLFHLLCTSC